MHTVHNGLKLNWFHTLLYYILLYNLILYALYSKENKNIVHVPSSLFHVPLNMSVLVSPAEPSTLNRASCSCTSRGWRGRAASFTGETHRGMWDPRTRVGLGHMRQGFTIAVTPGRLWGQPCSEPPFHSTPPIVVTRSPCVLSLNWPGGSRSNTHSSVDACIAGASCAKLLSSEWTSEPCRGRLW